MQALLYCRVSMDRAEGRSVREQEEESRRVCEREGWTVAHVITDFVGASRHSKGSRTGWAEAVRILEAGEVDVLVTWEASRAQRDLEAYAELRRICAQHKVLWSYSGRLHDLNDSGDRFVTGLDALLAEKEADQISERVRRAVRANAAAGKPHGRILYGYRRVYDPGSGRPKAQLVDPTTAAIVQRIFTEAFDGKGIGAIARDLNAEGIPSPNETAWSYRTVRRLLSNPAYAARRVHEGEVIGPADWPAIIDPDQFDAVQAAIDHRRGRRSPNTTRLLTSVARCGICWSGNVGVMGSPTRRRKYQCRENHCFARDADTLDAYVSALIIDRIEQAGSVDPTPATDDAETAGLRAQIAELEARWDELDAAASAGQLSVKMLVRQEQVINAELARLRDQLRRVTIPVGNLDWPTGDVGQWWETLPLERRRLYVNALIDTLVIRRTGSGRRAFDPTAIDVHWR